ncbi:MAG: ABC transporter permease [Clostridiales bacterium]|nr:ABC transporter permease [Clostridiales bacterium]
MRKNHIAHVMQSEWRKTSKTKVRLVMMLIAPLLSVLFFSWAMGYVRNVTSRYKAAVFCGKQDQDEILYENYPEFTRMDGSRAEAEEEISEGRVDVAVVVAEERIEILYDSSLLTSSDAIKEASDLASDLSFFLEGKEYYDDIQLYFPQKEIIDISTDEDKLETYMDQIAGVIGMIIFLMMSSNALTLVSGSVTGEKERQTFDTLVLCPVPLWKILLGKMLVLLQEVFLAGAAGIIAAVLGMAVWATDQFSTLRHTVGSVAEWLPAMVIILLGVSMAITSIFTLIASAFSETKKASLFASAGMVIVSFAAILPNFIKSDVVNYIPVANWTPVLKAVCRKETEFLPVSVSLLIAAVLLGISMILSSRLWERNHE